MLMILIMMDQLAMEYIASLLTKFWHVSFKNFAHLGCHIHSISEGEVGQWDFVRRWANTCHI